MVGQGCAEVGTLSIQVTKRYLALGAIVCATLGGCSGITVLKQLPSVDDPKAFETVIVANVIESPFPSAVVAAGLTKSATLDLVTATWGDYLSANSGTGGAVTVIRGQTPTGRVFVASDQHVLASGISSLAVGDFNGDGTLDIAVATLAGGVERQSDSRSAGEIQILFGKGDGTFELGRRMAGPVPGPRSLASADVNGDGVDDLIVGSQHPRGRGIGIILGGSFESYIVPVEAGQAWPLAVGDFDRDGRIDIAVVNRSADGKTATRLTILFGDEKAAFTRRSTIVLISSAKGIGVGDLNGDGSKDLVLLSDDAVRTYLNDGKGGFKHAYSILGEFSLGSVLVSDFDGDGMQDIVVPGDDSTLRLLFGNGRGDVTRVLRLTSAEFGFSVQPPSMAYAADIDGDGRMDIVVAANSRNFYRSYGGDMRLEKQAWERPAIIIFMNRLARSVQP
jgi:hypothetical protein